MIKNTTLCLLFFSICALNAQSGERRGNTLILEKQQLNFNFLSLGLDYEFRIGKNQTVSTGFSIGLATPQDGYLVAPAWNSRYRYYYNLNSRTRNGKNTSGNSGDYFAASYTIFIPDLKIASNIEVDNFNLRFVGGVYGVQRSFSNGFYFDVSLGAGLYVGNGIKSGIGPATNLSIGWRPKKKKKKPKINYLN